MKYTKFNDEVLYSTENIVKVDALDINELKQKARLNHRKRIRLCAHKSVDENIHEMLIVHEKSCYVRPHKHINKVESFHIIINRIRSNRLDRFMSDPKQPLKPPLQINNDDIEVGIDEAGLGCVAGSFFVGVLVAMLIEFIYTKYKYY